MTDPLTDHDLVERVMASDAGAFRLLFERHQPLLFRNALFLTGDADLAHEVVQETFCRIWERRARLVPELGILPYALRISTNIVRDMARHQRYQVPLDRRDHLGRSVNAVHLKDPADPEEHLDRMLLRERVLKVIRRDLPDRCREIFLLSRIEQKTNAEIAALLGLNVKTVENQIGQALRILRRKLG